jgi:C_GCAxxG_C_C family probable redox protein
LLEQIFYQVSSRGIIMDKTNQAVNSFQKGFNCSQSLLSTFAPGLGLDQEKALKITCAFGEGIGCMGKTCGAVTGALMVLSLKFGNSNAEDIKSKDKVYGLVNQFTGLFRERNGSIECRELLPCDISTPEGFAEAREKKFFDTICVKMVQDATQIVEQLLMSP